MADMSKEAPTHEWSEIRRAPAMSNVKTTAIGSQKTVSGLGVWGVSRHLVLSSVEVCRWENFGKSELPEAGTSSKG